MTDRVRAKMTVQKVEGNMLHLGVLYDPNAEEDRKFTKATPWGEAKLAIDNPSALEFFQPGHSYYLDFTKA